MPKVYKKLSQEVYFAFADAVTCLGSGKELRQAIYKDKIGLMRANALFSNAPHIGEGLIGGLLQVNPNKSRVEQIFDLLIGEENQKLLKLCDQVALASALGDLDSPHPGRFDISLTKKLENQNLCPVFQLSNACSSGTDALALAYGMIREGYADAIGVIAIDCLDLTKLIQHIDLGTQSREHAKPFSIDRSGTSFGEGGGFVILANEKKLKQTQLTPLARVAGAGMSCDAQDLILPDTSGYFPSLAIAMALENSGLKPEEIDYINAHGSGTLANDQAEAKAFTRIFGDHLKNMGISGTKGAIGHLLGATGLVEAIILAWAIFDQKAPGTAGFTSKDPSLNLNIIEKSKAMRIKNGLSVTLGFGGVNSCLALSHI